MNDFPTLETDRLLLRELVAADAPDLFAVHSDAEAMRWFGNDPLTDVEQAEHLIEAFARWRQAPEMGLRWAIERKADSQYLGSCGLFRWQRSWKSCLAGGELASFAWGKGYMVEALAAALAWGFDGMELNRVEAQVHPDNDASIRLVRRLGFAQEGRLREAGFWHGKHHDLLQFAVLRREFTADAQARQLASREVPR